MTNVARDLKIANNTIAAANVKKENLAALERLLANPDFQLIFDDLFMTKDTQRAVSLLSSHKLGNPLQTQSEVRENIVRDLHARGTIEQFFKKIRDEAEKADREIEEATQDIEDLGKDPDAVDEDTNVAGY